MVAITGRYQKEVLGRLGETSQTTVDVERMGELSSNGEIKVGVSRK